jgi:hypothetical protein
MFIINLLKICVLRILYNAIMHKQGIGLIIMHRFTQEDSNNIYFAFF